MKSSIFCINKTKSSQMLHDIAVGKKKQCLPEEKAREYLAASGVAAAEQEARELGYEPRRCSWCLPD